MNSLELFDTRITSPAHAKSKLPFIQLPETRKTSEIIEIFKSEPLTDNRVLYIHLPFCNQNCTFCGYYKEFNRDPSIKKRYVNQVIKQIETLGSLYWINARPFEAIYFGGGSPSSVDSALISSLMESIRKNIPLIRDAEITMEFTIRDARPERLNKMVDLGFNRISIGVQTFQSDIRKKLGRLSSGEEAIQAILDAQLAGLTNICIDLIYNLPNQSLESWKNDLETLARLPVSGCSVYPLIPFPNSELVTSGKFKPLGIREDYLYFKEADDFFTSRPGWIAFTPVQYGHKTRGKPTYIGAQGKLADMIALGPSSGGRINQFQYLSRFTLEDSLDYDFDFLRNSSWSIIDIKYLKYWFLYKLSEGPGISRNELMQANLTIHDIIPPRQFSELIQQSGNQYFLNSEGRFWAGNISRIITDAMNNILEFRYF